MDDASLFRELSELLSHAGIEVRVEPFKTPSDSAGGLCRMHGKSLILLDQTASLPERGRALLEAVESMGLGQLGVTGGDLSPALLAALNRRGQMSWPHPREAPSLAKGDLRARTRPTLVPAQPPLSEWTTIELGGPPDRLVVATTEQDVLKQNERHVRNRTPLLILGGGSNVVAADTGVRATVLVMRTKGIVVEEHGKRARVTAQAGENWHEFVEQMTHRGLAGLECLGGIPGCVGATPIQNVGAYGQEVSDTISAVQVLNRSSQQIETLTNEQCEFAYRSSVFKTRARHKFIVLSVTFELEVGGAPRVRYGELSRRLGSDASLGPETLTRVFEQVLELRREKSMVHDVDDPNHRSCGSFFVNPVISVEQSEQVSRLASAPIPSFATDKAGHVKIPAAWLIERAGFDKGHRQGNVGLSTQHTLCLVAHHSATSQELLDFASRIRERVKECFGVDLTPEPDFWGFGDRLEAWTK